MGDNEFRYTQCIVFNGGLKIPKGKATVQAGHASIGAFLDQPDPLRYEWFDEGQRKVALKAKSEDHLYILWGKAKELGIPVYMVEDLGLTVFKKPTITCLGLGPCEIDKMNNLTADLPLF